MNISFLLEELQSELNLSPHEMIKIQETIIFDIYKQKLLSERISKKYNISVEKTFEAFLASLPIIPLSKTICSVIPYLKNNENIVREKIINIKSIYNLDAISTKKIRILVGDIYKEKSFITSFEKIRKLDVVQMKKENHKELTSNIRNMYYDLAIFYDSEINDKFNPVVLDPFVHTIILSESNKSKISSNNRFSTIELKSHLANISVETILLEGFIRTKEEVLSMATKNKYFKLSSTRDSLNQLLKNRLKKFNSDKKILETYSKSINDDLGEYFYLPAILGTMNILENEYKENMLNPINNIFSKIKVIYPERKIGYLLTEEQTNIVPGITVSDIPESIINSKILNATKKFHNLPMDFGRHFQNE